MFKFLKQKSSDPSTTKTSWTQRLKTGLTRTRQQFGRGINSLLLGKKKIDAALLDELETALLLSDVGIETTDSILQHLTQHISRNDLNDSEALLEALKQHLQDILAPCCQPLTLDAHPFVLLMVGINGAGKTTSIAKLAHYYQQQGKKVMLAAGDTFRAAAIEQLQTWGERNNVPVIAQQHGADSASVIYDAMQAAAARDYDVIIADTAGRLHTQDHLMAELEKIKRVMQKCNPNAPHETMLVLDASIGQNALVQAEQFHKTLSLDSISITKLDGTAKGGILFAIANQLQLPIRFIGVGEQLEDLKPFDAATFVDALFTE